MRKSGLLSIAAALVLTAAQGSPAAAAPFAFGTTTSTLELFDLGNASVTPIGPHLSTADINGLAISPDGGLFGSDQSGNLFSVDPLTGAATLVGNTARNAILGLDYSGPTLIGADFAATQGQQTTVFSIDTTTAATTDIVTTTTAIGPVMALAVRDGTTVLVSTVSDGTILDTNRSWLHAIDLATGNTTLIGEIGFTSVFAIDFDDAGNLWGSDINGFVLLIDPLTAGAQVIGRTDQAVGLAMTAVWEPTTLAVFAAGVAGLGLVRRRRLPGQSRS